MRTNIVIEEELVREAFKYSDAKTKKELVHVALKEFVATHSRRNLGDLRGKISFRRGYDYKKMRTRTPA